MVIVVYLCVGVFAGCISADLASGKHRDALGWFFIGFLFPLLGVILAIVLPPNPVERETARAPAAVAPPPSDIATSPVEGTALAVRWRRPDSK
jgi:hypothetical protein